MRGDTHVRFGGRARETDPGQPGHRARARPNRSDTPGSCPTSDHRWSATQARLLAPHRAKKTIAARSRGFPVEAMLTGDDPAGVGTCGRCATGAGWGIRRRRRGAAPTRGSGAVYARSTTFRGRPESVDDGIAFCRDEVLPMCRELPGCMGLSMIVDRGSGRCVATSSWESLESMRATMTQLQPIRQRAAEMLGGNPEVAEWEIAVMHRDHRSADGACARVTWLRG